MVRLASYWSPFVQLLMVRETSLCGLGQSAPNPVLSTIHYFLDEYMAHIRDHHCPAGVCALDQAPVTELAHA